MGKSILIVLLLALSGFRQQAVTRPDLQVMKAAEGQVDVFVDKLEPGTQTAAGFAKEDDLDLCTIGKPYRVLEFKKNFLIVKNCLKPRIT